MIARSVSSRPCPSWLGPLWRDRSAGGTSGEAGQRSSPRTLAPRPPTRQGRRHEGLAPTRRASASVRLHMPSTTRHPSRNPPRIALAPEGAPEWLQTAIVEGGGHMVPARQGGGADLGQPPDPAGLADALHDAPDLRWVQLPVRRGRGVRAPHRRRAPLDLWQGRLRRAGRGAGADAGRVRAAGPRHVRPRRQVGGAAGPQPPRRPGDDPRRRRDHRVAPAAAATLRLPRHRGPQPGAAHGRRRRRAGGRPLLRRAPRRRRGVPRARAHARDDRHHQRRRAVPHGAPRLVDQRRPRRPRRHGRPRGRAALGHHRRSRSRRHRTGAAPCRAIRSSGCRTASSPRTSATRPRWPSRCWRPASPPTSVASPRARS